MPHLPESPTKQCYLIDRYMGRKGLSLLMLSTSVVVIVAAIEQALLLECLEQAQEQRANQCGDQDDLHGTQADRFTLVHQVLLLTA